MLDAVRARSGIAYFHRGEKLRSQIKLIINLPSVIAMANILDETHERRLLIPDAATGSASW